MAADGRSVARSAGGVRAVEDGVQPVRPLVEDGQYDSRDFRCALDEQGCAQVIPSNRSRADRRPYDKALYKARSEIECTFNLLKQARRFATRYEKTLRNYAAVVAVGCAWLWLRI